VWCLEGCPRVKESRLSAAWLQLRYLQRTAIIMRAWALAWAVENRTGSGGGRRHVFWGRKKGAMLLETAGQIQPGAKFGWTATIYSRWPTPLPRLQPSLTPDYRPSYTALAQTRPASSPSSARPSSSTPRPRASSSNQPSAKSTITTIWPPFTRSQY